MIFIEDNYIPEFEFVRKKQKNITNDSSSYDKRIDKKWLKRYGFKKELYFIYTRGNVYAHRNNINKLKSSI